MSNFTEDFQPYDDCVPPGVRLPKIEIDDKYYKQLGVSKDISTYEFLRKLCHKGVEDRGIDKLENKNEYYERAKSELDILRDLGLSLIHI